MYTYSSQYGDTGQAEEIKVWDSSECSKLRSFSACHCGHACQWDRQPCLRESQNYLTETVVSGLPQSLPNVEWTQGTKHVEQQVLNFSSLL
jgi:hypothetical protein